MKVKELIKELKRYDGEKTIILSCDEEGNAYYELDLYGVSESNKCITLYPCYQAAEGYYFPEEG